MKAILYIWLILAGLFFGSALSQADEKAALGGELVFRDGKFMRVPGMAQTIPEATNVPVRADSPQSESARRALEMYPDAGDPNSKLTQKIREIAENMRITKDSVLQEPDATFHIVRLAAANLGIQPKQVEAAAPLLDQNEDAAALEKARVRMQRLYPDFRDPDSALSKMYTIICEELEEQRSPILTLPDVTIMETISAMAFARVKASAVGQAPRSEPSSPARPTQYNGRPLPRNWIDPKQADDNFFRQQEINQQRATQAELERVRQELQRLRR